MSLIIETDLGHDPDDFFAICYLVAAGVHIRSLLITPGDPDQLAIAGLLRRELGLDCSIGASHANRTKLSSGSIHHELLKRYGRPLVGFADGPGHECLKDIKTQDHDLFVIGPAASVGKYLKEGGSPFRRATMQGGFAPYSFYRPTVTLDKFEGQKWMPTFNLGGDRKGGEAFLSAAMPRHMVGKNICHTVEFDKARFARFAPPKNRASELFCEAADLYFAKHSSKKLHDPTAAVLHLHPEVGLWADGKTTKMEGGYTTYPGEDKVLVDLDYEVMWGKMENWT
jgi:hypothetical protein